MQLTRRFWPVYNGVDFVVGSSESGVGMFWRK